MFSELRYNIPRIFTAQTFNQGWSSRVEKRKLHFIHICLVIPLRYAYEVNPLQPRLFQLA